MKSLAGSVFGNNMVAMLASSLDSFTQTANLVEGIFWLGIAACFLVSCLWPGRHRTKYIATANFAAFGCSDFVEVHTGMWWRPWWLLVWKGVCIVIMAVQLFWYAKRKISRPAPGRGNAKP
ncbi:MAG: hypothetical protein SVT52_04520 [Planctomycetota bacterium]|nr:hypothetical protein [Planctomycetota bacterium]